MNVLKVIITISIVLFLGSCQESVSTTEKTSDARGSQKAQTATVEVIDVPTFANAIDGKEVQLIDVRTLTEWNSGHIAGASHFEMNNPKWTDQITTLDKKTPVYVYCAKGGRSAVCAQQLKDAGFHKIIDLNGGVTAWNATGRPLTK